MIFFQSVYYCLGDRLTTSIVSDSHSFSLSFSDSCSPVLFFWVLPSFKISSSLSFSDICPFIYISNLQKPAFTFVNFLQQAGLVPSESFKQVFFFKQNTSKDTNLLRMMPQEQMASFVTVESIGNLLSHQAPSPGLGVVPLCFCFLHV